MVSRRDLLKYTGQAWLATGCGPLVNALVSSEITGRKGAVRCINVVNFLRGVEPRGPMDLFLPLQKQMEISIRHRLPTTWLLQYDALVSGPFVEYLKTHMPEDHEVGVWFEMNEMHCQAAQVEWRGRPGYEWDHYPSVAFTIGYTPEERIKLADAFMREFKRVWGRYPRSVASWNLDSITMAHLSAHYGIDAYAVCRDQIATDGFTIWGAPIAGYYPSTKNCWSPALDRKHQIDTPVFRMLGQDPVYYYQNGYPLPGGKRGGGPDTMEPVWPSGRSSEFIRNFLDMIAEAPTLAFAYAQLGQENNFGWPEMADAYPRQMKALAGLREKGSVHVETMADSGRRFKRAFRETPPQAQVMMVDPFGNVDRVERSIWYQSRFYRAALHLKGDLPYLRDLTVYSDQNPQPFLTEATRLHDVEQRMPAVLDGYHWSKTPGSDEPGAGGYFLIDGQRLRLSGEPEVREEGKSLRVELPLDGGRTLKLRFDERGLSAEIAPKATTPLTLAFEWDPARSALVDVQPSRVAYRWQGFDYAVDADGMAKATHEGWALTGARGQLGLHMAQSS
jgi:hypothetical protein